MDYLFLDILNHGSEDLEN